MCQIALFKSVKKVQKNTIVTAMTVVTVVRKITQTLHKKILQPLFLLCHFFGKCNSTHLTINVMFSGRRFVILAMFFCEKVAYFFLAVKWFILLRGYMIFFWEVDFFWQVAWFFLWRLCDFFVQRLRNFFLRLGDVFWESLHDVFWWKKFFR